MNKIIKRVVSAVTAAAIALTAVFVFDVPEMIASAAASGEGWSLDDNGKLTIENDTGMTNWKGWKDGWDADTALVKSVVIQDGVTSIGEKAFYGCNAMSSIAIPNSVTSIGKNAFNGCNAMSSIAIPNSVTSIDDYAFSYCKALSSITIPNGVTSIGNTAFAHCTGLSSITISASVTKMGVDVNIGCKKIETITFEGAPPSGTNAIINYTDGDLTTIYVPCNFVEDYKSAEVLGRTLSGKIQPKHNPAQVAAKAATCAAEGNVAHWHCSKCDKNFTDNTCATEITDVVVPKTENHTWNAGTVTKDPTCTAKGVKTHTCSVCNATKTEDIAALGHNWSTSWTTDGNNHWHTCTRSGCTSVDSKAAHSGGTATCQEKATCSVCGQKYGSLGAHDHSTTWSKDDTQHWHACQTAGCTDKSDTADHTFVQKKDGTNHWQECSVCGYKKDITAHAWGNWELTREPTLKTTGEAERACDCGEKDTKSDVPALTDPIWTSGNRTDPTLNGPGSEDYTSTDYGKVTIAIPALTDETVWTKVEDECVAPTEEQDGRDVYTSDDYGKVTVILPALDHTHVWGDWEITKAPSLNETGTAKRVCTKDDTHYQTEELPLLSDTTVWTRGDHHTDPTLKDEGSQEYTSEYGTVTLPIPKLTDEVWTKGDRTDPTLDGTGSEEYTSDDYGNVTITIPDLKDPIWTKGDRTDPTLDGEGSQKYISEDYGDVTITIPDLKDPIWEKGTRTDPTLEEKGSQEYTSEDYGEVSIDIPALTDPVWTKDSTRHEDPTEEADGRDVYTSVDYGEVPVILPALGHTHEWGNWTIIQAPTMETGGMAKHTCVKSPEHTETKALPALTDATVWTRTEHVDPTEDSDGRDVYTSEYGEVVVTIEKLPHTHDLTHIPEVPATETAEGVKEHWHCDGCGKDFEDENGTKELTADTIKIGKLEVEIQAPANVPQPEIATSKEELIAAALTEEEQKKAAEGTDIKIILKVVDASDSAPAEDKEKIDTAIGGLEGHVLGLYLDITLLKKIGEQEEKITRTNALITITFEVPSELHGKAEYTVVRVHDGEITVLSDKDSDPDTVTIETDRFSTYALTYQEKAAPPKPAGGGSHYSRPSTGVTYDDTSDETSDDTSDSTSDDTSDNTSSVTSDDMSTETSDVTSEDASSETSDDTSGETSDDTSGDISGDASDDMSGDISDDTSYSTSDSASGEDLGSGGSDHISDENSPSEDSGNPATGIAISLIPLAVTLSGVIVLVNRRKK